jgi:hypothetical protein
MKPNPPRLPQIGGFIPAYAQNFNGPVATFTHRQQPVATRFNDILDLAADTAAAIADNAWDEATPIDPDAARHWIRRLEEVKTSIVNAQAAAR